MAKNTRPKGLKQQWYSKLVSLPYIKDGRASIRINSHPVTTRCLGLFKTLLAQALQIPCPSVNTVFAANSEPCLVIKQVPSEALKTPLFHFAYKSIAVSIGSGQPLKEEPKT